MLSGWFTKMFTFFRGLRKKKETKTIDRDALKNHKFFTEIDTCRNYQLRVMHLVDTERTYIMKVLLQHKLDIFHRRFRDFVSTVDIDDLSPRKLGGLFVALIYSSINEYEEKFKAEAADKAEREILEVVLSRFNDVHLQRGSEAIDLINSIFSVEDQDNYTKMHSALYALLFPFVGLFGDALQMLYKLNGELTGKKFAGKVFKDVD